MASVLDTIGNPWIDIWARPRATIRRIVEINPYYHVILLAALAGAFSTLEREWTNPPGIEGPVFWPILVIVAVIFGAIAGIIELYISGALLRWAGAFLGGSASYAEVRAALAWARVPIIVALAIGVFSIAIGNGGPLMPYRADHAGESGSVSALHLVLAIWAFILLLKCLGEVHRFSAWRALGSILLLGAVLVVLVLAFMLAAGNISLPHPAVSV